MCVTACLGTFSRQNLWKCRVMCVTAWLWSFVCVPSSLFQMHGQGVVMCVTACLFGMFSHQNLWKC